LQEKIYVHGAIWNMHQAILSTGILLPKVERITPDTSKETLKKSIVIAPPGADGSPG
jgi:putative mRNA 3-end processing factor